VTPIAPLDRDQLHAALLKSPLERRHQPLGGLDRSEPDWGTLARELKRAGVSLMVLWEEYRETQPDGYGYSRFCDLFREFERRLSPVMRQHHVAGDKVFVDYSGKRIAIVEPGTGVVHDAEIFVGVLGASSYTYAEASFTQTLPDWIGAHVRMFRFFGGVPRLVVPDNLKSGVHKASFYDPEINRSYGMMAAHYGVGVLPARPRKPRDKAKVEAGVRFAQSYILGRLRHQTFFSLAECNTAIASCLDRMNAHVMRRLGVSRRDLFDSIERSALRALPAQDYEYAEWRLARVGLDYHVEVKDFFYSVPHKLGGRRSRAECPVSCAILCGFYHGISGVGLVFPLAARPIAVEYPGYPVITLRPTLCQFDRDCALASSRVAARPLVVMSCLGSTYTVMDQNQRSSALACRSSYMRPIARPSSITVRG
jgi:transposase